MSNSPIQNSCHCSFQHPNLLAAQSLQLREFQEQFQEQQSIQLKHQIEFQEQLQDGQSIKLHVKAEHSIPYYQMEEAQSTSNQQGQEEWTKVLERQQQIHTMLISILQPNATTMST
jgi:hypothetical protein